MITSESRSIGAGVALARLQAGNQRFVTGDLRFPTVKTAILAELTQGQHPYATILCCSDSRVPPELIFDAGFGELFVIRVAGNVYSPEVAASLQYAGRHLNTPLFVVLGHTRCGAVQAALDTQRGGAAHHSRIQILVDCIVPGLADLDLSSDPETLAAQGVEANVRWSVRQILETPEASERVREGAMKLMGAIYHIETGIVRFLD